MVTPRHLRCAQIYLQTFVLLEAPCIGQSVSPSTQGSVLHHIPMHCFAAFLPPCTVSVVSQPTASACFIALLRLIALHCTALLCITVLPCTAGLPGSLDRLRPVGCCCCHVAAVAQGQCSTVGALGVHICTGGPVWPACDVVCYIFVCVCVQGPCEHRKGGCGTHSFFGRRYAMLVTTGPSCAT